MNVYMFVYWLLCIVGVHTPHSFNVHNCKVTLWWAPTQELLNGLCLQCFIIMSLLHTNHSTGSDLRIFLYLCHTIHHLTHDLFISAHFLEASVLQSEPPDFIFEFTSQLHHTVLP